MLKGNEIASIISKLPGPKAKEIITLDGELITKSYMRAYPLVIEEGKGAILKDVDGNIFIDCTGGIGTGFVGHSHKRVTEAINEQSRKIIHSGALLFYHEKLVELAKELTRIAPGKSKKRVFFGNSGAESNECALKLVKFHSGKSGIISFIGGFHGRTMGALSVTSTSAAIRKKFGPLLPGSVFVPYPYCYRCYLNCEYPSCDFACVNYIRDVVLTKIISPEEVAGMIIEPIQGAGGFICPPLGYFERLYELCQNNNILLIVDEVYSGYGRTGKFFAIEHWGIEPDVITLAKSLAGGLPIGVCIAKDEVMDWGKGLHTSTFAANDVVCSAAIATLNVISEANLIKKAETLGDYAKKRLNEMYYKYQIIGDVRGKGLMLGIELVKDRKSKEPAQKEAETVRQICFQKGVVLLAGGTSCIRFCPPGVITTKQVDFALDVFESALETVYRNLGWKNIAQGRQLE